MLLYYEEEFRLSQSLIPLMAVIRKNKNKVRSVLDYRVLNQHIDTFTMSTDVSLLDLRKTYLIVIILECASEMTSYLLK